MITAVMLVIVFTESINAQEKNRVPQTLMVGVIDLPPFVIKDANGAWQGFAIDLLYRLARDLNTTIQIHGFKSIGDLKEALLHGRVELAPCPKITEDLQEILDFSNPYHRSGTAVAAMVTDNTTP